MLARLTKSSASDPRKRAAERSLRERLRLSRLRAEYASALRYCYEIKDTEHVHVREFRNVLLSATAALTLVVALLCVVGATLPDATPLCFAPPGTTPAAPGATTTTLGGQENTVCPSEEQPPGPRTTTARRLPAPGDVSLVALFGLMGGALSGAFAIRKLQGQSTPYGVPVAASLLKLPSGSLTAIVGILLVRGEFVPGLSQLDNQPQILAYAFFFGAASRWPRGSSTSGPAKSWAGYRTTPPRPRRARSPHPPPPSWATPDRGPGGAARDDSRDRLEPGWTTPL